MGTCPDDIKRLIEHFDLQSDQVRSPDYNETLLRIDFVNPLFTALGWDIDNKQHFAEQYREVVHEDRVKVAGQTKAPDYSFRIGGVRKFFLEAKRPSVHIKDLPEPAYQLRRYGWSAKLAVSILTNFEEFSTYDCRIAPKNLDKASAARREYITYHEYPERWDFIAGTFSKEAVLKGEFDRYCHATKGRGRQEFDDTFLEEIEEWRLKLASNLALRNDDLDEGSLNFAVQRIIDRIIFLRIAEDRGTESTGQLRGLINGEKVYERMQKLFRDADARYNSGLFHFETEKGRDEQPDTLTPKLEIDDDTLKKIIKRLYYPDSPYEFTVVTADILGSVYERFLGKVISLTAGHRAKIEEKPEVRKAGGVYYTPTYIVDYIVKNTVGELLSPSAGTPGEGRGDGDPISVKDAAKLKILDPACGSGSFLIGAYQYLLDWHLEQYRSGDTRKLSGGKNAVLRPVDGGDGAMNWRLTIAERKRILLDNIHGVDLDAAAVEVTKLNLLLKCLEGETSATLGFQQRLFRERALPDLGHNILCGNSLIGTDIMGTEAWKGMTEEEQQRINPFEYTHGFPNVFRQGGFDAVIGNPPYVLAQRLEDRRIFHAFSEAYEVAKYKIDTYQLFLERGTQLLCPSGSLGYIIPNTFVRNRHSLELRRFILKNSVPRLLRLFGYDVFDASVDTAILVTDKKSKAREPNVLVERADTFDTAVGVSVKVDSWRKHPKHEFLISAGSASEVIAKKMDAAGPRLGTIATAYFGIQTYDRKRYVSSQRRNGGYKPVIDGAHIERFHLSVPEEYLDFRPEAIKSGGNTNVYAKERIGVRQIGRVPIATMLPPGLLTLNTIYNIYLLGEADYSLRFVLAVLCSAAGRFYWLTRLSDQKKTFPKVKKPDLLSLPLPALQGRHQQVVLLVNKMLSLTAKLATERLPQRREQLKREVAATDRQIDQFVYKLYGLSDDEIRIVEEATR